MVDRDGVWGSASVQVVADYYTFPLSCSDAATADLLGECPSRQLRDRLLAWGQEYTENSLLDRWTGHADWVVRGRTLATQVRAEITAPGVRVFYLEESENDDVDDAWVEIVN